MDNERREHSELERRVIHILDYFDQHKETIIERMTSGVRMRELVAAAFIFGTTIMSMNIYLLKEHADQPHKDAVHKHDFNRAMDRQHENMKRLESKIDRIMERMK